MSVNDILRRVYYDVSSPGAFSSVDNLYRHARTIKPSITRKDVERFLSGEIAYTLHRRVVKKIKRNPIIANFYTDLAQADLVDVQRYAHDNNGVNFILTVIDVFTKKAFTVTLHRKTAKEVADALAKVFDNYRPSNLQTDRGLEFNNWHVRKLTKDMLVNHYYAHNERIKCSVVERFQRTLMSKIHKYFTAKGTNRFIGVLNKFVNAYNNSVHRTIKMTPNEARVADRRIVFRNTYGFDSERDMLISNQLNKKRTTLKPGISVRVPEQKHAFQKGYLQNFTDEIYQIVSANTSGQRAVYSLKDSEGHHVQGSFYPEEVQAVSNDDLYRVIVLDERKRGRGKQVLIRYANFPNTEPVWIAESSLLDIS